MIYYSKFCCLIRIAETYRLGDELLATDDKGDIQAIRSRFRDAHDSVDWYRETPDLAAHIMALRMRHHSADSSNSGERLIPTASAMIYTGRDRQVLYRWAREGRITRYGTPSSALWDILELPARLTGGQAAPPPPIRTLPPPIRTSGAAAPPPAAPRPPSAPPAPARAPSSATPGFSKIDRGQDHAGQDQRQEHA